MGLSNEDFGLLQQNVDALVEKLASLHLSMVIERDFTRLVEFLRANKAPLLNPTFNPDCSDLSRDAFWLRIVDEAGATVASHAQRIFVTDDFCDLIESGTLWYTDGMKFEPGMDRHQITRPSMFISGTVAHAGSLWVHPVYRKKGLSMFLPFLSRALALRNYECDFFTCIVLTAMGNSALPVNGYGYLHSEPCVIGWIPPAMRNDGIHLCYLSQAETMDQFRRLPSHPQYPVQLQLEKLQARLIA